MRFNVAGEFEIERHGPKKLIDKSSIKTLKTFVKQWEVAEEWKPGLVSSIGCYVFAVRAGKGITPHYVGQACRRTIIDEAMNSSNVEKYNRVLNHKKGTPVLFMLPMLTSVRSHYRKPFLGEQGSSSITFLEQWLIWECIKKNPGLENNRQTAFMRKLHVVGIFNAKQGESHSSAKRLWDTISRE